MVEVMGCLLMVLEDLPMVPLPDPPTVQRGEEEEEEADRLEADVLSKVA